MTRGDFERLGSALLIFATAILPVGCTHHAASRDPGQTEEFRATSHRKFDDVEHWQQVFEDPDRASWQKPDELIAVLGIESGMSVADVGAGTGYLLPYLSRAVGPAGRVVAVDVEPELVDHIRKRIVKEELRNVEAVLSRPASLDLPAKSIDLVLFVDTYHHVDRRREYFETVTPILARSGRLVVVDWKSGALPVGPREESHKIPAAQVVREMEAMGFRTIPIADVLPHQYLLVFTLERE